MTNEIIHVAPAHVGSITPGERWHPFVGPLAHRYLRAVSHHRDQVTGEALQILSRCTRPDEVGQRAGLVVGFVQSGKTTSFTTVAALAADNGYGLVIILGGTSTPLLEQTRSRIERDLELLSPDAYRRWLHVESPQVGSSDAKRLEAALLERTSPDDAEEKVPVIVTVMKQHVHMENLARVLVEVGASVDLAKVTALVIDDEADQASPNLKRAGFESATYSRLRRIRAALPAHTLLQYTATPQAPLLVSIADEISPDFVCTLTPGSGYTGGSFFFGAAHKHFVHHIDASDIEIIDREGAEPPRSLLLALSVYVLGCAVARLRHEYEPSQRSMLVHPSQKTLPQSRFVNWLEVARGHWTASRTLPEDDPDWIDHVQAVWEPAWSELTKTVAAMPSLQDLLPKCATVLRKLNIEQINATANGTAEVDWAKGQYWILVGGQLLDRGFTVEGLTVTYMPRGLGVGNADTLQQRARFFGYKHSYAAYCRMYLDPTVDQAFTSYVQHEDALRRELEGVAAEGKTLKEWKRIFFLDRSLRPTRQNVVRLPLLSRRISEGWLSLTDFADASPDLISANAESVRQFCEFLDWRPFGEVNGPEAFQKHAIAPSSTDYLLSELLTGFVAWGDDVATFTALRAALSELGDQECAVVRMSAFLPRGERRKRSLDKGRVNRLFQGRNSRTGEEAYLGDKHVRVDHAVTLQLHNCDLTAGDALGRRGPVLIEDCFVLALWLPTSLVDRILVQA